MTPHVLGSGCICIMSVFLYSVTHTLLQEAGKGSNILPILLARPALTGTMHLWLRQWQRVSATKPSLGINPTCTSHPWSQMLQAANPNPLRQQC